MSPVSQGMAALPTHPHVSSVESAAAFAKRQCPVSTSGLQDGAAPAGRARQRPLASVDRDAYSSERDVSHFAYTFDAGTFDAGGWAVLRAPPYGPGCNDRLWPAVPAVTAVTAAVSRDRRDRRDPPRPAEVAAGAVPRRRRLVRSSERTYRSFVRSFTSCCGGHWERRTNNVRQG